MVLELVNQDVQDFRADALGLIEALNAAIVGHDEAIEDLVVALIAGGHVLLEGLPGLGKTELAKAVALALDVPFSRIQCTPDIMPSDIIGSEIPATDDNARRFRFERGPLFASLVLVDEVNRAAPKTQAALLEAMQEGQVTVAGERHALPRPFWVVATQNMIELDGTYPLPEAQLDRFFAKIALRYPGRDTLVEIANVALDGDSTQAVRPLLSGERVIEMMEQCRGTVIAGVVREAAADLVLATQPGERAESPARHVLHGASPRALQSLLRAARVRAQMQGRAHVAIEDIRRSALPILRHRVILGLGSRLEGIDSEEILGAIVEEWCERWSKENP